MWKTYAECRDDVGQRRAALRSLVTEENIDSEFREAITKEVLKDLMVDIPEREDRRCLARAVHRLSRDSPKDSALIHASVMKRLLDLALIDPFDEEIETPDYFMRALHNVIVHNHDLSEDLDQACVDKLYQFLHQPKVVETLSIDGKPVYALRCAVRVFNVGISRPWFTATVPPAERRQMLYFVESMVERLIPPKDTPQDSWEMSDELGMVFNSVIQLLHEDTYITNDLFAYARHAFLSSKIDDDNLLDPVVQYATTTMACCETIPRSEFLQSFKCAKKLGSLLVRTANNFIEPETGEPTPKAIELKINVETFLAPLWILTLKFAEADGDYRSCLESRLFLYDEDAKDKDDSEEEGKPEDQAKDSAEQLPEEDAKEKDGAEEEAKPEEPPKDPAEQLSKEDAKMVDSLQKENIDLKHASEQEVQLGECLERDTKCVDPRNEDVVEDECSQRYSKLEISEGENAKAVHPPREGRENKLDNEVPIARGGVDDLQQKNTSQKPQKMNAGAEPNQPKKDEILDERQKKRNAKTEEREKRKEAKAKLNEHQKKKNANASEAGKKKDAKPNESGKKKDAKVSEPGKKKDVKANEPGKKKDTKANQPGKKNTKANNPDKEQDVQAEERKKKKEAKAEERRKKKEAKAELRKPKGENADSFLESENAQSNDGIYNNTFEPFDWRQHAIPRPESPEPVKPPTKPVIPQLNRLMSSASFPMLAFVVGQAMFSLSKQNGMYERRTYQVRIMLDRFGIELSAGPLFAIGEQQKMENALKAPLYDRLDADKYDEDFRPNLPGLDKDLMTAEQFYDLMILLDGAGIINVENPLQRAHEEGVLEDVEKRMNEMELREAEEEDEELQKAVEEWTRSKMRHLEADSDEDSS